MKVFIVYAHPEPTSFNAALRDRAVETLTAEGHEVVVTDLYADGFDVGHAGRRDFKEAADTARFDYQVEQKHAADTGSFDDLLAREQERLFWCDLMIFQFPLWWFGVPSILKSWIDRVLAYGKTYDLGHRYETGMLQGRRAMVCLTTGGPERRFGGEGGQYKDIGVYMQPIEFGVFEYMGFEVENRFVAWSAPRVTDEERHAMLDAWADRLRAVAGTDAATIRKSA